MRGAAPALGRRLAAFWREEAGGPTVEFVIIVPFFFAFFIGSFEIGMLMVRQTMLDRGLDLAVREVRLGHFYDADGDDHLTHDTFRQAVCERAVIIPECNNRVMFQMVPVNPRDWRATRLDARCIDMGDPGDPVLDFNNPGENELTIVRACALFRPYAPVAGLGASLQRETEDFIAVWSTSAFVVEPR